MEGATTEPGHKIIEMKETKDQSGTGMKVEIWSDVMCPFCYIGKRKFELALERFEHRDRLSIEWKSFQLMPDLQPGTVHDLETLLVETKGMDPQQVKAMNAQVARAGEQVGIDFNFDRALGVNTLDAHRFIHFAKGFDKQNEAEEALFRSYFTQGRNVGDFDTLIELGEEIGLDVQGVRAALENGDHADGVRRDIAEARALGVRGVPFFVMDRTYAVSGAQQPEAFLETLEKSFMEWQGKHPSPNFDTLQGSVCEPGKACD